MSKSKPRRRPHSNYIWAFKKFVPGQCRGYVTTEGEKIEICLCDAELLWDGSAESALRFCISRKTARMLHKRLGQCLKETSL